MDIANSAKYTRSEGPDGIDPMVAKKSIDLIGQVVMVVSDIINASFDTGIVPLNLKLASVTPVFKQGDKYY